MIKSIKIFYYKLLYLYAHAEYNSYQLTKYQFILIKWYCLRKIKNLQK